MMLSLLICFPLSSVGMQPLATGHPPSLGAKTIFPLSTDHIPGFLCCNVSGVPPASREVDQDTKSLLP